MLNKVRGPVSRVLAPPAGWLARHGVNPNVVTVIGTIGVAGGALGFYPRGELFWGTVVITLFVFSDMIDGALARARGGNGSQFGAFLDSSLDRIGDAAIFAGLILYYANASHYNRFFVGLTIYCLVFGQLTSYVRARAEGLGVECKVGIAERSERLIIVLVAAGLSDLLNIDWLLKGALWLLAALSTITVIQRIVHVYRKTAHQELP